MQKKNVLFLFLILANYVFAQSPSIEILTSGTKTSLRGLSVVNDNIVWVSGSNGMVGKSVNGGKNWKWMTVRGFEKTEVRDIEAAKAEGIPFGAVGWGFTHLHALREYDPEETFVTVGEIAACIAGRRVT